MMKMRESTATFLKQALRHDVSSRSSVWSFTSSGTYPLLFFNRFFSHATGVGKQLPKMTYISLEHTSLPEVCALLSQSFLGEKGLYFFGDISSSKLRDAFISFLGTYDGLHTVMFFIDQKQAEAVNTGVQVGLEATIDKRFFEETLLEFFDCSDLKKKHALYEELFAHNASLTLERSLRLIDYLELVGVQSSGAITRYRKLFESQESSLFTLAHHFFARDKKRFFALWGTISEEYPPLFWISYWSNQLWGANFVVRFLTRNDFASARGIGSRLPFSFTKKYWHTFKPGELTGLHDFLYKSDFRIKQGGIFPALELMYIKHFEGVNT